MLTRSGGKRIVLICGMLFRKKKRKSHFITTRDRKRKILHSCSVTVLAMAEFVRPHENY